MSSKRRRNSKSKRKVIQISQDKKIEASQRFKSNISRLQLFYLSKILHWGQKNKRKAFLGLGGFLVILLLVFYFVFEGSNKPLESSSEEEQVGATLEAKLKEVYEKRAGISLGDDFSLRFSVFEDSQLGFKIAYPVGFIANSTNNGVIIKPAQGGGNITVTVNNGSFEVTTNKEGLDKIQAEIIDDSGIFIRESFEFINQQNSEQVKDRFFEGPGKDRY